MFRDAFINEINFEGANTRKLLERVPLNDPDWTPHERSRNIEQLARHVANLYSWIPVIINQEEIDFSKGSPVPPMPEIKTNEALISYFDLKLKEALTSLENTTDEDLGKIFTMRSGEKVLRSFPKAAAIRNMALNHLVHHRGQLGVYLRLMDIPIPGMYGPSADEK